MNCGKKLTWEGAMQHLEKQNLRLTKPRLDMLKRLVELPGPVTIDELHRLLNGRCDWATVFRCLKKFEELGLVTRCEFGDKQSRYEMAGSDSHHHHHLICRNCKRVEQVEECSLVELEKKIQKQSGFSAITHSLEFFGLCPQCRPGRGSSVPS